MFELLTSIVLEGAAGGTASFLVVDHNEVQGNSILRWLRFAFVGVVAAFAVPLFLSLTKSTLIDEILSAEDTAVFPGEELLIIVGVCILAAFVARNFLDGMAAKILEKVSQNQDLAKESKKTATETFELIDEHLDHGTSQSTFSEAPADDSRSAEKPIPRIDETEQRVLSATASLSSRTLTGIAKDAHLSRDEVERVAAELVRKGLVEITVSPRTGNTRRRVTPLGASTLNKLLSPTTSD